MWRWNLGGGVSGLDASSPSWVGAARASGAGRRCSCNLLRPGGARLPAWRASSGAGARAPWAALMAPGLDGASSWGPTPRRAGARAGRRPAPGLQDFHLDTGKAGPAPARRLWPGTSLVLDGVVPEIWPETPADWAVGYTPGDLS